MFPTGSITVVPSSQLQWLINQPRSVLSVRDYQDKALFTKYVMPHPLSTVQDFHEGIIWHDLSRVHDSRKDNQIDETTKRLKRFCGSE